MSDIDIKMSILPCLTAWRPLGALVLVLTGVMGLIDLAAFGDLITPRGTLVRMLVLVTGIEAIWHLGRTVYDAWPGAESVATALFETAMEMSVMYLGYASLLTITTVMARGAAGTPIGSYVQLVNMAAFLTVTVMEGALMVVHWKGVRGAKRLFNRMRQIAKSKGKDVDAVVGKRSKSPSGGQ